MDLPVNVRGSGDPLLMIHGNFSDGSFFDEAAGCLEKDFTVITYDRRGYGHSDVKIPDTDYSVAAQAEDAATILRKNARKKAWVFGTSGGGLIGVELALRYPQLVRGLILLEPSLVFDEKSKQLLGDWNRELNEYVREGRIRQAVPAFARVIGSDGKAGETGKSLSMDHLRMVYKNLTNFMLGELNEIQNYYPALERVKAIKVPVLVAVSKLGEKRMFAVTSKAGALSLGWPLEYVPGNHNAVKEQSVAFSRELTRIIGKMRKEEMPE